MDSVTPANYVAGTNDYDVDVIIPAGYQNAGSTITCENISATATTTTAPPVNYTLTLASGTSGAQAVQFTEATPNSQSINYTQSPNSGTPAVLVDSLPAWLTSNGITGSAIQLSLNADSLVHDFQLALLGPGGTGKTAVLRVTEALVIFLRPRPCPKMCPIERSSAPPRW